MSISGSISNNNAPAGLAAQVAAALAADTNIVRTTPQPGVTAAQAAVARGNIGAAAAKDLALAGGIAFNGTATYNEHVKLPTTLTTPFTAAVMFKVPATATGWSGIIGTTATNGGWGVSAGPSGLYRDRVGESPSAGTLSAVPLADGLWHVIVVSLAEDKRTFSVAIDGGTPFVRTNQTYDSGVPYFIGYCTGRPAAAGTVIRSAVMFNRADATHAECLAALRGEYALKDLGGTTNTGTITTAWTDSAWVSSGGTITTNTGGTLAASHTGASALYALELSQAIAAGAVPPLSIGRKVRIRYSLTLNSGTAPRVKLSQGNIDATAYALTAGASQILDCTIAVATFTSASALRILLESSAATDFTLSGVSIEILGLQFASGPDDWCRTRGVDRSGNCNDLIYGAAVVPLNPVSAVRCISATVAGATLTAGAAPATIGNVTGLTYRDKQALTALRQWDAVSANWRRARPANCAALIAAAPANGTTTVESHAIASNATIAANAAINLAHTID